MREAALKEASSRADQLLGRHRDHCDRLLIKSHTQQLIGSPREELCKYADLMKPDLLVVGSRGLGSVKRMLIGSVSDYLIHNATTPVLVAKAQGSALAQGTLPPSEAHSVRKE